jgi:hypothetical protein
MEENVSTKLKDKFEKQTKGDVIIPDDQRLLNIQNSHSFCYKFVIIISYFYFIDCYIESLFLLI